MIRQRRKRRRTTGNQPPPSAKPPTPICYVIGLRMFRPRESRLTHASRTPTEHDDVVVLESLIHGIPNQATSNHGSAGCWVIGYLREPSSVDLNSLS